jgi:hypothetical protein
MEKIRVTHTPRLTALFVFAILLLTLPDGAALAVRAQNGVPRTLDGSKLPPAPAPPAAAGEQKIFRGYVGEYRVRMRLRRAPGGKLSGSYSYEGRGGELTLKGAANAKGDFTLEEFDGAKKTGAFKGRLSEKDYEPEASLSGNWTKPGGASGDAQYFYLIEEPQTPGVAVATKQVKEVNKKRGYRVDAEYPQIEGAAKFNALAEGFVTKEVAEFKRGAGREPGEKDSMPDAGDDSLDIRYFVRLVTDGLISVEFQLDYYEHGAAHGSHAFYEINYDAKSGRELKLADLFKPNSHYLKRVSEVAIRQVRRWNKDSAEDGSGQQYLNEEGIKGGAAPDAENYGNWTLTPRGLAVTFDYYQLGAYAAGAPKVVLPYADLEDVIRADGPLAPFIK